MRLSQLFGLRLGGFAFVEPGRLIDRELELVRPHPRFAGELMAAFNHPESLAENAVEPIELAQIHHFLDHCPGGNQSGETTGDVVPAYHFWMRVAQGIGGLSVVGTIGLRIGFTRDIEVYYGHFGYNVYPPARGRHFAERACRLLLPLAARHMVRPLWITCNPDNHASRRTCERLGGRLVEIVRVPESHPLFVRGDQRKCRYRVDY